MDTDSKQYSALEKSIFSFNYLNRNLLKDNNNQFIFLPVAEDAIHLINKNLIPETIKYKASFVYKNDEYRDVAKDILIKNSHLLTLKMDFNPGTRGKISISSTNETYVPYYDLRKVATTYGKVLKIFIDSRKYATYATINSIVDYNPSHGFYLEVNLTKETVENFTDKNSDLGFDLLKETFLV